VSEFARLAPKDERHEQRRTTAMPRLERWIFTITPLPHRVPAVHRIRSALKLLLRCFGLRCVAVLDLPEDPATTHQTAQAASRGIETTEGPR
jgi:hypothetical protein